MSIKPFLILLLLVFGHWTAEAQVTMLPGEFRVKAGDDARQMIPRKERYRYESFQLGTLFFIEGKDSVRKSPPLRLNYNYLRGEIQALISDKDTADVQNSRKLKFARIGADLYYNDYDKGYFEILNPDDPVRLAVQSRIILLRHEVQGSNGYTSIDNSSMAISSYRNRQPVSTRNIIDQDGIYKKKANYYLMDKNDFFDSISKSGVLRMFPRFREKIQGYIKQNKIDFYKEEDLKKLLRFCNDLE
jgi:hypothetical protein